jgi:proton-translocating NADH-quinone oxidoreductase chain M
LLNSTIAHSVVSIKLDIPLLQNSIMPFDLLTLIIGAPRLGSIARVLLPTSKASWAPTLALTASGAALVGSTILWARFDRTTTNYQFVVNMGDTFHSLESWGLVFGVDGLSIFFVWLTALRTPLCVLASITGIKTDAPSYYALFLLMEFFVLAVFTLTDLLWFYIAFESVLIPMFRLIGRWGSRERKVRAAYFFFLYTLIGSVLMLVGIAYVYSQLGTTDIAVMTESTWKFSLVEQQWLWLAFFASFAVKVPMVPVHIWLPEAHVEAPTAGSVMLAGVLLKLGTYGMLRLLVGVFPAGTVYFTPRVYMLALVAIVYTSLTAIRQTDIKRIIAYASVAHMNMTLIGLFSMTIIGLEGAILQMLSHGFVSGALFLCVGVLYDRHHTRLVSYYGGLSQTMPIYAIVFLFFTMANIALPGTSSFVGEFMILVGISQTNTFTTLISSSGMVLGGAYSLWLANRLLYGNPKTEYVGTSSDLTLREWMTFVPLIFLTLRMGVYPNVFLEPMHSSCAHLVEHVRRHSGR